jgi:BioD-like phosphotransacetylase family protein
VLEDKIPEITRFVRSGLKRKGLELLGVLPHEQILAHPTVDLIRAELRAELLNQPPTLDALVEDIVVGAMGAQNARQYFKSGALLLAPGDREDILQAVVEKTAAQHGEQMAGVVLTGGLRPGESMVKTLQALPIPVLLAKADSYQVAAKLHNLTVKTRPADAGKIALIRELVARHINVKKIIDSL